MAYVSVLKSYIKMISSNYYSDKQGLSSTCQFPECNSCIFWALWFHSMLFFPMYFFKQCQCPAHHCFEEKNDSKIEREFVTVTFPYSFLTYLFLFHFSALTNSVMNYFLPTMVLLESIGL